MLADDFECRATSLLTDVHLWGSWKDDRRGQIQNIEIRIHPDDPVGPAGTDPQNEFSKPEPDVLWAMDFGPDEFTQQLYYTVPEPGEFWWDPLTGELLPGGDSQVWQIDIPIDPAQAFLQRGTEDKPVIYWLDVRVTTERRRFRLEDAAVAGPFPGRRGVDEHDAAVVLAGAAVSGAASLPRPGSQLDRPGVCADLRRGLRVDRLGRRAARWREPPAIRRRS